MAHVVLFTKIGCVTSLKQIELLRKSGHEVEVRDLLAYQWQPEELITYFGARPVKEWFNQNSPRIKSGEIDPDRYQGPQALGMMLEDHLLIGRPLMESDGIRVCGFDPDQIKEWIGVVGDETRRKEEYQTCSQGGADDCLPT